MVRASGGAAARSTKAAQNLFTLFRMGVGLPERGIDKSLRARGTGGSPAPGGRVPNFPWTLRSEGARRGRPARRASVTLDAIQIKRTVGMPVSERAGCYATAAVENFAPPWRRGG